MDKIVISTLIHKPVKQVFDFISTPENDRRWQTGNPEAKQTSQGPMGLREHLPKRQPGERSSH